ncbi:MAG: mono/diheme cytochrome c family protein [Rhodothermales bacterium]|jgi:mono/diheme cytochrome c family protein
MRVFLLSLLLPSFLLAAPIPGPLSAEESRSKIVVPDGFTLELIASEPFLDTPALLAWDADSRLYVSELRSYMRDIDCKDEFLPISRVLRFEDSNGDGTLDRHTVFADGLIAPRSIVPFRDHVLIQESNSRDLYAYRDADGDGVAEAPTRVFKGGELRGDLEHQPGTYTWALDNWLYVAFENRRYRFRDGEWIHETLPGSFGQWGITQDDFGTLYYSRAGGDLPAQGFQFPPSYGIANLPGQFSDKFNEVHPLCKLLDVEGGAPYLHPDGGLRTFTGCCGQSIYRDDFIAEFAGNYLVCEPVGRLIRRAEIRPSGATNVLHNPTPGREFIASPDPYFRPVFSSVGPDGCIYIADLAHGVVQHAKWVGEGSYLRPVVQDYGLDKQVGFGRLYRLRPTGKTPRAMPKMSKMSSAQLVGQLGHPSGWWRDTAQRLLVQRKAVDMASELRKTAKSANPLARLHALWTLEGLDILKPNDVRGAFADSAAIVRASAMRLAEPMQGKLVSGLNQALAKEKDARVLAQAVISLRHSKAPNADKRVARMLAVRPKNAALQEVASIDAANRTNTAKKGQHWSVRKGAASYNSLCVTCHGADGKGAVIPGTDIELAAPLAGSPRVNAEPDVLARILLHGLVSPIDGHSYPGMMAPVAAQGDPWISGVMNYVRNSWGHSHTIVTRGDVSDVRHAYRGRNKPWTIEELSK